MGDFRGIRDFVQPAEFPEMLGIVKENKEQRIGRDGKTLWIMSTHKKRLKGIYGFCLLVHRNASGRKREQFHQGQYTVVRETGTEVCRNHNFPGNQKKYLPKKDHSKSMDY